MATNYLFTALPLQGRDGRVARLIYEEAGTPQGTLVGRDANKGVLDRVYRVAAAHLHDRLKKRDTASWLTIALEQFDFSTSLFRDCRAPEDDNYERSQAAPCFRYSWKYVIDYCVRALRPDALISLEFPTLREIEEVATLLVLMYGAADMSNWLSYFPDWYEGVEGHYAHDRFAAASLKLPTHLEERKRALEKHLTRDRGDSEFSHLVPPFADASTMRVDLDNYLSRHYGVVSDELTEFACCFADWYSQRGLNSTVLVGEFETFVDFLSKQSGLSEEKAQVFLQLILQDEAQAALEPQRDFLCRSNRRRMGFFGGVRVKRMKVPGRFQSPTWDLKPGLWHLRDMDIVVISAFSAFEAGLLQLAALLNGQVGHLGPTPVGSADLASLQRRYRVNCFEAEVRAMFRAAGWVVIGPVQKVRLEEGQARIPCGEIDALAYSPTTKRLLIVEAKCLPLATDVKMWHSDATDFDRKYTPRIEKKTAWCSANKQILQSSFLRDGFHVDLNEAQVASLFVTLRPHISAMLQVTHRVLSVSELKKALAAGIL